MTRNTYDVCGPSCHNLSKALLDSNEICAPIGRMSNTQGGALGCQRALRSEEEVAEQEGVVVEGEGVCSAGGKVEVLAGRSEEHTSELQSLAVISYAVFC